ncbi:thioesterase superfamily protein [Coniochaeta sp. 2T2.1]|nr:thioesterase superfamily protein [Coniochaeta sp. 2T2.1]
MSAPKKRTVPPPDQASPYDIKSMIHLPAGQERIQLFIDLHAADEQKSPESRSWMAEILPHLSLISSSPASPPNHGPRLTFRFDVKHVHSNAIGNMQGGCISTVFDYTTSLALGMMNRPGFWFFLGVTRTLTVTVLRPVVVGEAVLVECEVVHAGRKLAHIKGTMRREGDGAVLAVCEHDKVNSDPPVEMLKEFMRPEDSKL